MSKKKDWRCREWSDEEIKSVVNYYKKHNISETAREFHTTTPKIKQILLSQGVRIKAPLKVGSLCNFCKRAARFLEFPCPWAKEFEPVKGWDAEKTILKFAGNQNCQTYRIKDCPLFMEDD